MLKGSILSVAFAAMVALGDVSAADATVKSLMQSAKANPGSKVVVMHERGEPAEGVLTDVAGDVFCVAMPLPSSERKAEICYAYSSVQRIGKVGTGAHSNHTPVWVSGVGR